MTRLYYGVGALLLLGFMAAALAYAVPAAWVAQYVASAAGGRVQLAYARGLWHRGSGILLLSSGAGGTDAVHWMPRVHWDVAPPQWPLRWILRVTWPQVGPPLLITLRAGVFGWSAHVAPWRGVVPLSVLAGFGAPFNTLGLEGEAQISLSELKLSSATSAKSASGPIVEINIVRLRSALAQGVVLGDYMLRGQADKAGSTFMLRTAQGPLLLHGKGQCRIQGRLTCDFEGTASVLRRDFGLLGNLLGLLGKEQGRNSGKNLVTELRW